MLRIHIAEDASECEAYCKTILDSGCVLMGLDIECVTAGKVGNYYQNAELLQICVPDSLQTIGGLFRGMPISPESKAYTNDKDGTFTVYLIRVSKIYHEINGLPKLLSQILRSKEIIKVGCDINLDVENFYRSFGLKIEGCIDDQLVARSFGIKEISMDNLGVMLFNSGKYKIKQQESQNIDWSSLLTDRMIQYAAYDAYLSLIIYRGLINYFSRPVVINNTPSSVPAETNFDPVRTYVTYDHAMTTYMILTKTTAFAGKKPPTLEVIINTVVNSHRELSSKMKRQELAMVLRYQLKILHNEGFVDFSDENSIKLMDLAPPLGKF